MLSEAKGISFDRICVLIPTVHTKAVSVELLTLRLETGSRSWSMFSEESISKEGQGRRI